MQSKGAPVPVTRNRGSNLSGLWVRLRVLMVLGGRYRDANLGVHIVLNLIQALRASLLPALMGTPAEITGPRWHTIWVESGVLIQWNKVRGVGGAEDVATVTTVVTTKENAERRATSRGIAIGRGRVSLKGARLASKNNSEPCDAS